MGIRRKGQHALCLLVVAGMTVTAHAGVRQGQEGRIEFRGAVVPATEPGIMFLTTSAPSAAHGAATEVESLEMARRHSPPELLDYFAGYAGRETRVFVTTYY